MDISSPCLACMLDQGERLAQRLIGDDVRCDQVIAELRQLVYSHPTNVPPPVFYRRVYDLVSRAGGTADPFKEVKRANTAAALEIYPRLKELVHQSAHPLETAIRIAIAGNIIDHGVNRDFDEQAELEHALRVPPRIMDYDDFHDSLEHVNEILYIADNAGETVYDRVLIETIDKPTIYAVRSGPIINDATMDDAIQAGLDHVTTLVTTGSILPGIYLEDCNSSFQDLFNKAEMVISKGMGNFETLIDAERPIFFMLKVKCGLVAVHLGVGVGESVLLASSSGN